MVKYDIDNVNKDIIHDYFKLFKMNTLHNVTPTQKHNNDPPEIYYLIEDIVNEYIKQFVTLGIDYSYKYYNRPTLTTVEDYGDKKNIVITSSLTRQYNSCHNLNKKIQKTPLKYLEFKLIDYFCEEINFIKMPSDIFHLKHIKQILKFNLSMPLRAINSFIPYTNMFQSEHLNIDKTYKLVKNITYSILSNTFVDYKFKSIHKHLSHLSLFDRHMWKYQYKCMHEERWLTTEGDDDYFIYLWAGKIGDVNHSFDYFPQCLYPFLCNARNKIIFVYDKFFNKFTARAYIRILQSKENAYLWLENVECCPKILLQDSEYKEKMNKLIYHHARIRAKQLHITLATPCINNTNLQNISIHLDPSDGIFETSRYINELENWIQTEPEKYNLSCYIDDETK